MLNRKQNSEVNLDLNIGHENMGRYVDYDAHLARLGFKPLAEPKDDFIILAPLREMAEITIDAEQIVRAMSTYQTIVLQMATEHIIIRENGTDYLNLSRRIPFVKGK